MNPQDSTWQIPTTSILSRFVQSQDLDGAKRFVLFVYLRYGFGCLAGKKTTQQNRDWLMLNIFISDLLLAAGWEGKCHGQGGLPRFKLYSKGTRVLCVTSTPGQCLLHRFAARALRSIPDKSGPADGFKGDPNGPVEIPWYQELYGCKA